MTFGRPEEINPPNEKDEKKEKERCSDCLDYFEEDELYYTDAIPNTLSKKVCSFCLHNLHSNI